MTDNQRLAELASHLHYIRDTIFKHHAMEDGVVDTYSKYKGADNAANLTIRELEILIGRNMITDTSRELHGE